MNIHYNEEVDDPFRSSSSSLFFPSLRRSRSKVSSECGRWMIRLALFSWSFDSDVVKRELESESISKRLLRSNAEKFLSLTNKEILGEGDNTKLEIQIKLDNEKKILSIRDRGIGMTKEDLVNNLGTIALELQVCCIFYAYQFRLCVLQDSFYSPLHMDYELIEARARFDEEYPEKTSLAWPVVKEYEANFTIIRV
ncbi:hypothetical protein P8452_18628 [Trifolium repens]|nr:hypothetical protein P8452_18628 [Trifolium repens]